MKEHHVIDYIREVVVNESLIDVEVTYDKQVQGGCSRKRPDVLMDFLTHSIIIEVDETQHSSEEYCACENKRMMQIFQDLGSRPVVFIRFNPDKYTDRDGNKHPSLLQISQIFRGTAGERQENMARSSRCPQR